MKAMTGGDDYAERVARINRHYINARWRFAVYVAAVTAWACFRLMGG